MAMYKYTIAYRPTATHGNADAMSRLPLTKSLQVTPLPPELILLVEELNTTPIIAEIIRVWTNLDPSVLVYDRLWGVGGQIMYRMYSSSQFQPVKMSCQCKMVAFLGETKWSFPKQVVVRC